jgi:hypothetical protein
MKLVATLICSLLLLIPSLSQAQKSKNKQDDKATISGTNAIDVITKIPMDKHCSNDWKSVGLSNTSTHTVKVVIHRITTRNSGENITDNIVVLPPKGSELLGCEGDGAQGAGLYSVQYQIAAATYQD